MSMIQYISSAAVPMVILLIIVYGLIEKNKVYDTFLEGAKEVIERQNKQIEDYKKEGHTYLVTEDTNGRVFLWDSTEKPKKEIEDVYFPEELKDKAKEGNKFLYQNGTYVYVE